MIQVMELVGYDLAHKASTIEVFVHIEKDGVKDHAQSKTVVSYNGISEDAWGSIVYVCLVDMCIEMKQKGFTADDVVTPSAEGHILQRIIEIPYPFTLTKEEFVAGYTKIKRHE